MDVLNLNEVTVSESTLNSDLDRLVKLVKQDWKSYAINIKVIHLMKNTWTKQYSQNMSESRDNQKLIP